MAASSKFSSEKLYLYLYGSDPNNFRLDKLPHSTKEEKCASTLLEIDRVVNNLEKINVQKLRPKENKKHVERLAFLRTSQIAFSIIQQYPILPVNFDELLKNEYNRKYVDTNLPIINPIFN